MNVAVIGASDKPHRYSYMAVMLLSEKGHQVFPVHQRVKQIEGRPVFKNLEEVSAGIDTITLYVNSKISSSMKDELLSAAPRRIIFNPGTENPQLEEEAREKGIECVNACTLVMLKTGQF